MAGTKEYTTTLQKLPEYCFVRDSREQDGFVFPLTDLKTVVEALPTGDYGVKIEGVMAPCVAERKSHADLFASFSGDNYRREKEKIERAKELGWRYVLVVESTASKIRQGCKYYKQGEWHDVQKDGLSQLKQLLTISQRYQIELALCDGKDDATIFTQELLLTYVRNWEAK